MTDSEELTPHNREETLELCRRTIEVWNSAKLTKEKDLVEKMQEDRERSRNRLPKFLRWILPPLTTEQLYFEIKVNRQGWNLTQYLEVNYDYQLEPITEILELCERSDGQNVLLTGEQTFELEEARTTLPPK